MIKQLSLSEYQIEINVHYTAVAAEIAEDPRMA